MHEDLVTVQGKQVQEVQEVQQEVEHLYVVEEGRLATAGHRHTVPRPPRVLAEAGSVFRC